MQTSSQHTDSAEKAKLPNELIHHIVECLEDRHDEGLYYSGHIPFGLTDCSLVCHSWNEICRTYIFRSVSLCCNEDSFTRLAFLHSTAPHLYKYIHVLEIVLDVDHELEVVLKWIPDAINRFTYVSALHLDTTRLEYGIVVDVLSSFGIMSLLSTLRLKQFGFTAREVVKGSLDLVPILSARCSTTLDSLSLSIQGVYNRTEISEEVEGTETRALSPVRLHALRNLKVTEDEFQLPHIECPNLKSLMVEHRHRSFISPPWSIPSWIPAGLPDLVLKVHEMIPIPDFGTSLHPSMLTINISQHSSPSFHNIATWIGDCVNNLPEPSLLRELTLEIYVPAAHGWSPPIYPDIADFKTLYRAIQPLKTYGGLKQIKIGIFISTDGVSAGKDEDASAAADFKEAFTPMLEEISVVGGVQRIIFRCTEVDVLMRFE